MIVTANLIGLVKAAEAQTNKTVQSSPVQKPAPVIMPPKPKEQQSGKPGLPIYGAKRLALEVINNEIEAREKDPRRYGLIGDMLGINKKEELLPKPKPLFGW